MNQTRSPPVINFFKFLLQRQRRDAKEISVEVKKQTVEITARIARHHPISPILSQLRPSTIARNGTFEARAANRFRQFGAHIFPDDRRVDDSWQKQSAETANDQHGRNDDAENEGRAWQFHEADPER